MTINRNGLGNNAMALQEAYWRYQRGCDVEFKIRGQISRLRQRGKDPSKLLKLHKDACDALLRLELAVNRLDSTFIVSHLPMSYAV